MTHHWFPVTHQRSNFQVTSSAYLLSILLQQSIRQSQLIFIIFYLNINLPSSSHPALRSPPQHMLDTHPTGHPKAQFTPPWRSHLPMNCKQNLHKVFSSRILFKSNLNFRDPFATPQQQISSTSTSL